MTLRSPKERLIQILAYEFCALCIAVPFYALIAGREAGAATVVMVGMMLAEMIWAPLHDTVFDYADFRATRRVASDRPKRWRVVHALSREFTTMAVTLPVIILLGGHSFWEGFWLDLGLTLMYSVYGFFFYLGFDILRPVVPRPRVNAVKSTGRYVLLPLARINAPVSVRAANESYALAALSIKPAL
jgi:uncharacterized membrane protein